MGAAVNLATEPADRVINIQSPGLHHFYAASCSRLGTEPEHMTKWWGPRGFKSTVLKVELRPWRRVSYSTCSGPTAITGRRVCIAKSCPPDRPAAGHGRELGRCQRKSDAPRKPR